MARNLRIRVDHNTCVGNAMYETFAPNVFRLNDNRQSEAVDPSGDSNKKILEAARTTLSLGLISAAPRAWPSRSRRIAGASGFLTLSQYSVRPAT